MPHPPRAGPLTDWALADRVGASRVDGSRGLRTGEQGAQGLGRCRWLVTNGTAYTACPAGGSCRCGGTLSSANAVRPYDEGDSNEELWLKLRTAGVRIGSGWLVELRLARGDKRCHGEKIGPP